MISKNEAKIIDEITSFIVIERLKESVCDDGIILNSKTLDRIEYMYKKVIEEITKRE